MEGREAVPLHPFKMVFSTEVAKIQHWYFTGSLEGFLADFFLLLVCLLVHNVVRKGYLIKMLDQPLCAFLSLQFCLVLDVFAVNYFFVVEDHLFERGIVGLSRVLLSEGVPFLFLPLDF